MAGQIPREFIDQLVQRADIVEVIGARVALKKAGRDHKGLCPFHNEKTPSFTVNRQKQVYYCFGCGAGGNVLSFVMEHDKLEFVAGVESLASSLGLEVPRLGAGPAAPSLAPMYALLERGCRFYEEQLRRHPERSRVVDYLKGRGLSGAVAKTFRLGYAPPGRDALRRALCEGDGGERPEALADCGLLRREDGRQGASGDEPQGGGERLRDHLWQRAVFPIRDARGRVLGFGARALADGVQPKYLNSPESKVFQKRRVLYGLYENQRAHRQLSRLLLVEGYMDVIALFQHGVPGAVATLGTALTQEHLELAFRHVPELVLCFDGDAAGRQAAARALQTALPAMRDGRQVQFLFLPDGHDPDSLVREIGAAAFNEKLASELCPLSRFLIDQLAEGLDLDTPDGRASLWQRAQPQLAHLPAPLFRELLLRELAPVVGMEPEALRGFLPTAQQPPSLPPGSWSEAELPPPEAYQDDFADWLDAAGADAAVAAPSPVAAEHTPERELLLCLFSHPTLAEGAGADQLLQALADRRGEPPVQLLIEVIAISRKRPGSSQGRLLGWFQQDADAMALIHHLELLRLIQQDRLGAESDTQRSTRFAAAFEQSVAVVVAGGDDAAQAERGVQLERRITEQVAAGRTPSPEDRAAFQDSLRATQAAARRQPRQ